jgi:hypothetical protein
MRTTGALSGSSRGAAEKVWRVVFRVIVIVVAFGALAAVLWLSRPVPTGAGELSRLAVGRVYYELARRKPGYCQEGYIVGILGAVVASPAIAIDKACNLPWIITPPGQAGRIAVSAVPGEAWRLFAGSLDGLFHDPRHKCPLPRPEDWTNQLLATLG